MHNLDDDPTVAVEWVRAFAALRGFDIPEATFPEATFPEATFPEATFPEWLRDFADFTVLCGADPLSASTSSGSDDNREIYKHGL